jgi:hypothetical protein
MTREIAAQEAELARPEGGREEAEAAETSRINFLNGEITVVQNELAELKAREDKDALDLSAAPAGIEDLAHGLQRSRDGLPDGSMAAAATNAMLARGATEIAQADMIAAMGEAGTDVGEDCEVYYRCYFAYLWRRSQSGKSAMARKPSFANAGSSPPESRSQKNVVKVVLAIHGKSRFKRESRCVTRMNSVVRIVLSESR